MAVSDPRIGLRGQSSPDLGQERPQERVRPTATLDLGVRDDEQIVAVERPSRDHNGYVVPIF
jgi:hypothetical protein